MANALNSALLSPEELTWKDLLAKEKKEEYLESLLSFVSKERRQGKTIFPRNSDVFNALTHTPFPSLKVVILGQDPYHGVGQAHGLCFSVQKSVKPPPSLVNIYKEIENDIGLKRPSHGCLTEWAEQGVLLLNSVLTVEAHKAGSHSNKGWERFTDKVIEVVNEHHENIVFLLWGAYAQKKGAYISTDKHCVLKAPHPSPLSAHRGFLGCKHFSKTNEYLLEKGKKPIDWLIT